MIFGDVWGKRGKMREYRESECYGETKGESERWKVTEMVPLGGVV